MSSDGSSRILDSSSGGRSDTATTQKKVKLKAKKIKKKAVRRSAVSLTSLPSREPTFTFHGKDVYYSEFSLGFLSKHNYFRLKIVQLTTHPYFEMFILGVIFINAIILALVDYSRVDNDNNPVTAGSIRNQIVHWSNLPLAVIFTTECLLRIIAMGFISTEGAYLNDAWYWLDLLVVITSLILVVFPDSPSISIVRTFRIFRPLKTITSLPALKSIVTSIFSSVPQLGGIVLMLLFLFILFATAGLQFFSGNYMHSVCRSTPYPVYTNWTSDLDYTQYKCIDDDNFDLIDASHTKPSSPWSIPQHDCYWPIASDTILMKDSLKKRLCSYTKSYGNNLCEHEFPIPQSDWSWCGSDYDAYGNNRFSGLSVANDEVIFFHDYNFGYTNFDNFGKAFLVIFQTITGEGWSQIMYMVQDSCSSTLGVIFFVLLILSGTFFTVQLLLAVLAENFHAASVMNQKDTANDEDNDLDGGILDMLNSSDDDDNPVLFSANYNSGAARSFRHGSRSVSSADIASLQRMYNNNPSLLGKAMFRMKVACHDMRRIFRQFRRSMHSIKQSNVFNVVSAALIVANLLVFMLDRYPCKQSFLVGLENCNALLSILFFIELFIKVAGSDVYKYMRDWFSVVDAIVVIISIVFLIIYPPPLFSDASDRTMGVNITLLRSFRLVRMLRLAGRFKSIKTLLTRIVKTFIDLFSFMVLLFLFLFIYTLIGMQFFANLFRFDENGYAITQVNSYEWKHAPEIPRYHFDDFNNAFASVFQVMSTENWNTVLYDCWRSRGPFAVIYPCSATVIGTYILMNLFLAILLSNFDSILVIPSTASGADTSATAAAVADKHRVEKVLPLVKVQPELPTHPQNDLSQRRQTGVHTMSIIDHIPFASTRVDDGSMQGIDPNDSFSSNGACDSSSRNSSSSTCQPITHQQVQPIGNRGASHNRGDGDNSATTTATTAAIGINNNCESKISSSSGLGTTVSVPFNNKVVPFPVADDSNTCEIEKGRLVSMSSKLSTITSENDNSSDVDSHHVREAVAVHRRPPIHPSHFSKTVKFNIEEDDYSLLCLSKRNKLRKLCISIVFNPTFDSAILALVAISSITLALDNPLLDPTSSYAKNLNAFDIIITSLFVMEMIAKIVALDFVVLETAYIRSPWNVLDFVIVLLSIVSLTVGSNSSISAFKSLRVLRAFRPLRLISRAPRLKVLVNALLASIPQLLNVLVVILLFFSLFSIVAVSVLKGQMRSCSGDVYNDYIATNATYDTLLTKPIRWSEMSVSEQSYFGPNSLFYDSSTWDCSTYPASACCPEMSRLSSSSAPTSKDICECWGGRWQLTLPQSSFDNFPIALITFFSISTTEGWVDTMYAAVDSTGIGMQPIRNNQPWFIYFFIIFIVFGNFFALNLFIGVLMDNFQRMKQDLETGGLSNIITETQLEWMKTSEIAANFKPNKLCERPSNYIQAWVYDLIHLPSFEYVILFIILCNTVVLASQYWYSSESYSSVLNMMNFAFTLTFTFECVLKLVALRWHYFDTGWHLFDFTIVVGSDIALVLQSITGSNDAMILTIVRSLRALRIIRLLNSAESIKTLSQAVLICIPGLFNIFLLLLLCFFIYTILGVQLFAKTAYYGSYDAHANFRSIGNAWLTLFRFSTGEAWPEFMADASHQLNDCVDDPEFNPLYCGFSDSPGCIPLNGCGTITIYPYLMSFTFIVTMCMCNLLIGIILEGFNDANDYNKTVKPEDLSRFAEHWANFDPKATYFISFDQLEQFIMTLFAPLGYLGVEGIDEDEIQERITQLHLHVHHGGRVHFKDVITALSTEAIRRAQDKDVQHQLDAFVTHAFRNEHLVYASSASSAGMKYRSMATTVITAVGLGKHTVQPVTHVYNSNGEKFTAQDYYAAILLQRVWKKKKWNEKHPDFLSVVRDSLKIERQRGLLEDANTAVDVCVQSSVVAEGIECPHVADDGIDESISAGIIVSS